MPELPEVETIRQQLEHGRPGRPSILDKQIHSGEVLWSGVLTALSPREFTSRIPGQRVNSVGRRGKHLLIHLSEDTLIMHLRMSGDVFVEQGDQPLRKHDRLLIHFTDGARLAFNNVRKFGRVQLTSQPRAVLAHLGPEPLDEGFSPRDFFEILQKHNRQVKYLLLDQKSIAGLGNIYTDEALHVAGIHPRTKSDSLSFKQTEALLSSIRKVLRAGIKNQGTSIDWMYRGGDYQQYLLVYGQEGQNCPQCGTIVKRIKLGQRSTYFCPSCQPQPGR